MNNLPTHQITKILDTFTNSISCHRECIYVSQYMYFCPLGKKYNHIIKNMMNLSNNDIAILQMHVQILYVMSLIPHRELIYFL